MRKRTRRHWYHCTPHDKGPAFTADRRPPDLRADKEPLTPRLCVCDTPAACMAAVLFPEGRPVFVYRTEAPRNAVAPVGVWDRVITGERWLVPPVRMVKWDTLGPPTVEAISAAIRLYHWATRDKSSVHLRVAQYMIAVRVLGDRYTDPAERRLLARFARRLGIGDPEEFILSKAVYKPRRLV